MSAPTGSQAALLEARMGDPSEEGRVLSYARCAALDQREEFPLEMCRELDLLGLPAAYVPSVFGGTLSSYDDTLHLLRAVARRDLTVAVAHGKTFLGAVSVWVGGTHEQASVLGGRIARGAVVSWGLTEREHGSDLLAGEVSADPVPGGFRVDGEKWLINNATRGELMCLLARNSLAPGPRSHSLLLVDKAALDPTSYRPLPAVRLHGIRGADISGIAFHGALVPDSALVGPRGGGIELVLKSLQLTRTLCASLSLGAADQALDLAAGYITRRKNFGRRLVDLPQSRRQFALAAADALLAEACATVGARSVHALTGELATSSAAVKYLVPTLVDQVITRLSRLMGSRSLLVGETHEHGRFQKVQRDHRIVGIFDGSTIVNLNSLITQFPLLARSRRNGSVDRSGLAAATDPSAPLPEVDRDRLTLLPRGGCSPLQALASAVEEVCALPDTRAELRSRAQRLVVELTLLEARIAASRPSALDVPAEAFRLAEQYAACYAGAAAVHLWLRGRGSATGSLWAGGLWLEACLARVLDRLRPHGPTDSAGTQNSVFDLLVECVLSQRKAGSLPSLHALPRWSTSTEELG